MGIIPKDWGSNNGASFYLFVILIDSIDVRCWWQVAIRHIKVFIGVGGKFTRFV